ncbi:MAG: phytoene desaturase family protein [Vicinamibacterales bacterium]
MTRRAVIIGGGLGGLATAVRLGARGWRVTVCEQGDTLGGKMNRAAAQGFVFDTGPSLITMPWVFEDLFTAAGSRLDEHLELVEMQPLARYVFADGTSFDYTTSLPAWLETVRTLEPADVDGFWRFLRLGARIFELSSATFFRRSPLQPPDRRALAALRHLPLRHAWGNYHAAVEAHFKSPYLRQLFDRYPTYVGSSPYAAPATLAIIPYIEFAYGGWYVTGGLYRIVSALSELAARHGVELRTGTRVTRIEHHGKATRGVTLDTGERLDADVVVMNGDASDAPALLGRATSTGLPPAERSMSGLVWLIATRRSLPEQRHHTVFFSADYRREFADLFDRRRFPSDPTVYVNIPSRTDRTVVPGEGEAIFVMANAPANDHDEWDAEMIEAARAATSARLDRGGFPDLGPDIVWSDVWTPARLASRYLMPGGAIYGTHSHGWRHAFLRPPNQDRTVAGLYYVGGSTHPGGGTPTVLMSAEIVSGLIAHEFRQ